MLWLHFTYECNIYQEDESEIEKRKRREEDEEVDVMGDTDSENDFLPGREIKDDDVLWAEMEPDLDDKEWNMKVLLVDDTDY